MTPLHRSIPRLYYALPVQDVVADFVLDRVREKLRNPIHVAIMQFDSESFDCCTDHGDTDTTYLDADLATVTWNR